MNCGKITAGLCALLMTVQASAGEQQQTRIEIAIDDDADGQQSFVFDSEDAGFDLSSMLVGESRSVTDRAGNTADLHRTADGFQLAFDGKTIELPGLTGDHAMHGEHQVEVLADGDDVDVVKEIRMIRSGSADGVTIISGSEIDAETRERIAEVLKGAGHDGEIAYIDSAFHDGEHQAGSKRKVRVIRREVDVTNQE